jgi:4-hydroxy-3-methylbut-2-enyl diphosphate reductase IspH
MALDAAKTYPRHLYTLGPLIHNPQAVEFLETLGMKARDRIGFTAGASTPLWIIKEVESKVWHLKGLRG